MGWLAVVWADMLDMGELETLPGWPNIEGELPEVSTLDQTLANLQEMQQAMNLWEGESLRATGGGTLRADKSFWYLIDFEYQHNQWKYQKKQNMPVNFMI